MVRILRLSNSTDQDPRIPEAERVPGLVADGFARRTGQETVIVVKAIWPTAGLPSLVDRWLDEIRPDVVIVCMNSFWYTYPSVPLRLQRKFGRAGDRVASTGLRIGGMPFVSRSRLYHVIRRNLTRVVGGDTHFTPEQSLAAIEAVLRRVAAREDLLAVARAGVTVHGYDIAGRWAKQSLARWHRVDRAMRETCERLHVEYLAPDGPVLPEKETQSSDIVHPSAEGHRSRVQWEVDGLVRAWERVHAPARAVNGADSPAR